MNINSPFPLNVDALIEQLDTIYPDQVPTMTDSDREVWMKVGQVSVISFLKAWRKHSLENQPYVPRIEAKDYPTSESGKAGSGLHQSLLHGSRPRRRGR